MDEFQFDCWLAEKFLLLAEVVQGQQSLHPVTTPVAPSSKDYTV